MVEFFGTVDTELFRWINTELATPLGDLFFPWITDLHKSWLLWSIATLAGIGALVKKGTRLKKVALFVPLVAAVIASDFIVYRALKPAWQRTRPWQVQEQAVLRTNPHYGYSFPSNHASNVFALASAAAWLYPRMPLAAVQILFFLAAIIAYSRVYVGVHYPSDVIAGALFGALIGSAVGWIARRQLIPNLAAQTSK